MRWLDALLAAAIVVWAGAAQAGPSAPDGKLGFGTTPTPEELSQFFAYQPDGRTLPPGRGSVAEGKEVFAAQCAMCHGEKLEGIPPTGAPALAGGRGSLTAVKPLKTVESYWPYATTLFDYIKRAMPFTSPGSLNDDQVYAVVAFILANDKIVGADAVMDRDTLPKVAMPNRAGFRPYAGPDHRLYR